MSSESYITTVNKNKNSYLECLSDNIDDVDNQYRFYVTIEDSKSDIANLLDIQVNLKTKQSIYVHEIIFKLIKAQSIFYNSTPKEEFRAILRKVRIYKNPLEFESFSSGHHKFPLRLLLNQDLSGSINSEIYSNSGRLKVENRYFLEILANDECKFPILKCTKELIINEKPLKTTLSNAKIEFSYCFCFFSSECDLIFNLDKPAYKSGDLATLSVGSDCKLNKFKIKQVRIELFQVVKTSFGTLKIDDEKVIFKTKGSYDSTTNRFTGSIRIPRSAHSSVKDVNFDLKYQLIIYILFHMADPIRVRKEIKIINNKEEDVQLDDFDVLEGISQPVQFIDC